VKIIAEAWDAAGAYQVGDFPGRWQEWNGRYRDDVRRFWKGDSGSVGPFATRICGSEDLYNGSRKGPCRSINFVTCHDGFSLIDLLSYNTKHNIMNGEDNRDGENHNFSYNHGIEGPAPTAYLERIRLRQSKNLIATLFLSQGIPMLLSGDEFLHTKQGNNNTYCQDNEISWLDWRNLELKSGMFMFVRGMIRFRKAHHLLRRRRFFTGRQKPGYSAPDITWHGVKVNEPQWGPQSRSIALLLNGEYSRGIRNSRRGYLHHLQRRPNEPLLRYTALAIRRSVENCH
jgi:glycogen operon protein